MIVRGTWNWNPVTHNLPPDDTGEACGAAGKPGRHGARQKAITSPACAGENLYTRQGFLRPSNYFSPGETWWG